MKEPATEYFESLDGFRALAALFILLFHSLFPCFQALWIGVPMFFVLSGFLITRILISHKSSSNYFKAFYFKRSLRIFPIYYLALFISVLWGLRVHNDLSQLPVFVFYLQNFTISMDLQPKYCNGLMNHTWSLSSEELFYLIWPLVILAFQRKALTLFILCIGVASILYKLIMISLSYKYADLLMLSLAGNLDGLMAGAFLGLLSLDNQSFIYTSFPKKQFFFAALIFLALFSLNNLDINSAQYFYTLKVLLSIATVVFCFYILAWLITHKNRSFLNRFLGTAFLKLTGKISYGLYLYHVIIYGISEACVYHYKIQLNPVLFLAMKIIFTYVAALLSWRYIEKPLLRWKNKINY